MSTEEQGQYPAADTSKQPYVTAPSDEAFLTLGRAKAAADLVSVYSEGLGESMPNLFFNMMMIVISSIIRDIEFAKEVFEKEIEGRRT